MTKLLEFAETQEVEYYQDTVYDLDKIRANLEVVELIKDRAWLVKSWDEDWLSFAVIEYVTSDGDGANTKVGCIFSGKGPSGSLRECRHTYWGEYGYLFYLDAVIISAAFKALSEYFDDMIAEEEEE